MSENDQEVEEAEVPVETEIEEPVEEAEPVEDAETPEPEAPAEVEDRQLEPPLALRKPEFVKVKAHQNFRDGAFKKDFDELGYTKPQWNEGEVRLLPARLYFKLQQRSGNQFALVGDS